MAAGVGMNVGVGMGLGVVIGMVMGLGMGLGVFGNLSVAIRAMGRLVVKAALRTEGASGRILVHGLVIRRRP